MNPQLLQEAPPALQQVIEQIRLAYFGPSSQCSVSAETGLHVQQPKATTVPRPTDLNEGNALLAHFDAQDHEGGCLGGGF